MTTLPLSWRFRKWLWNTIITTKFGFEKPVPIFMPPAVSDKIGQRHFYQRYPDIPLQHVMMSDRIPSDEKTAFKLWAVRLQENLNHMYGAMQSGLPEISADGFDAQKIAITKAHRKHLPPPQLPHAFQNPGLPDLGVMAVASPYALFLKKDAQGRLVWDLGFLSKYDVQPGLRSLGAHVVFDQTHQDKSLHATHITCDLGTITPQDSTWPQAVAMALCSATTYYSVVLHLINVHFCMTDPMARATRNTLATSHPLFRLLWPHIVGTQNGNDLATYVQLAPDGDFVNMYALTAQGLNAMMDDAWGVYQATSMNPVDDWQARGLNGTDFEAPVQQNMLELWDVLHAHPLRYLAAYFDSDQKLADDPSVQAWVAELNTTVPNGVDSYFPNGITRTAVARLVGAFIHLGVGLHGILGNAMWHYNTWPDKNPIRLYKNGQRLPHDVYQRIINQIFVINVHRAPLLGDYSTIALDDTGRQLFQQFHAECLALQDKYNKLTPATWRQAPNDLQISMNAFG